MLATAQQGLLAVYDGGQGSLDEWVMRVWETVQENGGVVRNAEGVVADDADAALAVLRPMAEQLRDGWLPSLRRLQVIA